MNATKNAPEKKFSTGGISASVWKNMGKSKTGEDAEYRTVSLQRRYSDKDGTWKSSNTLRVNDLPKAILVLQKSFEHLAMKAPAEEAKVEEEIVI